MSYIKHISPVRRVWSELLYAKTKWFAIHFFLECGKIFWLDCFFYILMIFREQILFLFHLWQTISRLNKQRLLIRIIIKIILAWHIKYSGGWHEFRIVRWHFINLNAFFLCILVRRERCAHGLIQSLRK